MDRKGYSATEIGSSAGMSARQVNKELERLGYQTAGPGYYLLTDKGKEHSAKVTANRGNVAIPFNVWDEEARQDVLDHNKDKVAAYEERMEEVRKYMEGFEI